MKFVREQVLKGGIFAGAWCNLGSSLTTEMTALAGFDWVLIDMEHGSADYESLVYQAQAVGGSNTAPIVRIAWNETPRFKRVLDLGVSGVMVPYVNTREEATQVARSMRYPPEGIRGVASQNRAGGFGFSFPEYFPKANDNLLTVVQIETEQGVENSEAIAGVEGIDVLFVGPLDLSVSMGIPRGFDKPKFRNALAQVVESAHKNGKQAGILLASEEQLEQTVEDGFTFIAIGSDGGLVAAGMRKYMEAFKKFK
jgi:2-keto-3-deoxy-L-rhamnonate aldolase RhmA